MGKSVNLYKILSSREAVLLATVVYLLETSGTLFSAVVMSLAVYMFLADALVLIMKQTDRFKWDKVILVSVIVWAMIIIGLQVLDCVIDNAEWLKQAFPVLETTTLVLCFALLLTMFVLSFTYLGLQKRGKWNFKVSADNAVAFCMGDYSTVVFLLLACTKAL